MKEISEERRAVVDAAVEILERMARESTTYAIEGVLKAAAQEIDALVPARETEPS